MADQPDPQRARWQETLTKFVAPVTLTTTLLYYFGFLRSQAIAREFGYDASLLGLSSQDYLLRSVPPMTTLASVVAVAALVWYYAHHRLETRLSAGRWSSAAPSGDAPVDDPDDDRLVRVLTGRRLRRTLLVGGFVLLIASLALWIRNIGNPSWLLPGVLVALAATVGYGAWLEKFRPGAGQVVLAASVRWTVAGALIAALFAAVTVIATEDGRQQAQRNLDKAGDPAQPFTSVISSEPLSLGRLSAVERSGEYVYSPLVLMFSENGRHFLIPAAFDDASNALVHTIPAASVRLEFDRSRSLPCAGFEDLPHGEVWEVGDEFRSAGVRYVVEAAGDDSDQSQGTVSVERSGEGDQHLVIEGAAVRPALGEVAYGLWEFDFRQMDLGVFVEFNGSRGTFGVLVEAADSDAFGDDEIDVDGRSIGRAWMRDGGAALRSASIGGKKLIIDCGDRTDTLD